MATISLCLIVRDEAATLPTLLASIKGAFDEVVAVDTGSTDGTITLLEAWAKSTRTRLQVEYFEWTDDFAAARNYADSLASGDWLCWADADDEIRNATVLRELAASAPEIVSVFRFPYDYDGTDAGRTVRERLIRRGAGRWIGRVHEEKRTVHGKTAECGGDIAEWIHRPSADRTSSGRRNASIVARWLADEPNNPAALFCAGREAADPSCLDIDAAIRHFRRYLDVQPQWSDQRCLVTRYLGILLVYRGGPDCLDEAIALARDAIHERPEWSASFLTLAEAAQRRGDTEKAKKLAQQVIKRGQPKTFLPLDPQDYDERPQAILNGIRVEHSALEANVN